MSSTPQEMAAELDGELAPGTRVGEYEVEGLLGKGAFGQVFKATHPLIGKVVAIKVLGRRFSVDPEMVSRFVAEARAVNQIRHRHIIDIFSFGALEDGRQYYVMEYLDGEPLDAVLARGQVPVTQALGILRGIARALDAAHAKGIAHRDLKAENVFVASDPDGAPYPKLLDFGIAKLLAPDDGLKHKTRTGAPIGTPYYMSPEQCRGKDVDHRTDHYAFGVLAYLMLTGVFPHDADDYMSILMKQISDEPAPPSSHAPALTPAIDDVVLWLLAKDPADRPADLRTAVRALEEAAEAAGLHQAPRTSAVDVPTGGRLDTQPRIAVPRTGGGGPTPVTMPGVPALAATIAPGPARSRLPLVVGLATVGAAVLAAVLVVVLGGGGQRAPVVPVAPPVAPAVVAPTPPPPAVVAEPPQTVIVDVTGVPPGTEVLVGGMVAGAAPGPVQLPRTTERLVLTFRADGHATTSRTVTPDHDQALTVTLDAKPAPGRPPRGKRPGSRDDILDPFAGGTP